MIDSVETLRMLLLEILKLYTGIQAWEVMAQTEHLDFQFICSLGGFVRKSRSLDFTMANTDKEWIGVIQAEAKSIAVALTRAFEVGHA